MTTTDSPVMRQPADWMSQPGDDRILELVNDLGNLTPRAIANRIDLSREHITKRCGKLAEYGLLERIDRGLYGLTDEGRAYLDEELDAATLSADDE